MKVGSLVEFVGSEVEYDYLVSRNTPYTVRNIFNNMEPSTENGKILIHLVEVTLPICMGTGREYGFEMPDFRELQPPMDISELIEECQTQTV